MRGNDFLNQLENIDPAYIEAAAASPKVKSPSLLKRMSTLAACLVLLISAGIGSYIYAEDVKNYNASIQFFNEYGLSTEGLTRGEIKSVYRDITTKSFTYSKTAEVIANSISTDRIEGYEILQENPTPEYVENIWNYMNYVGNYSSAQSGIHYSYNSEYEENYMTLVKSVLEKYDGENLLWSASVTEFVIFGYSEVSDGVIAYGETPTNSSKQISYAWLAKFDNNGQLLWKRMLHNNFKDEYVAKVLEHEDGSYAVITRGDLKYFCLNLLSHDGEPTYFKKTEIGNYGISNAARFGDGYIVQLWSYIEGQFASIVKVDREGNITDNFSYSAKDSYYYITDMIEFNGNIYLSAYAVPKLNDDDNNYGGRYEIAAILNQINKPFFQVSHENLTDLVRKNYTAMLLVCTPNGGEPQEFYSVDGSLGGKLAISTEGNLLWDVESIAMTYYSPATSSFTIGGSCNVFRYTFDNTGKLVSQNKTGETTGFRR